MNMPPLDRHTRGQLRKVLVTVGTTEFGELMARVTTEECLKALQELGCRKLVLQVGCGERPRVDTSRFGVESEVVGVTDDFKGLVEGSDLVISHAGAGSCLHVLRANKPLLAVPNPKLLGNHQEELAEELSRHGFCASSSLEALPRALRRLQSIPAFRTYQPGDARLLADHIRALLRAPPPLLLKPVLLLPSLCLLLLAFALVPARVGEL